MWQDRRMAYAILRTQKLKSAVAVFRSLKHAFREQETPNADAEQTPDNTHIGATSSREAMEAFRARLPEKHRKDAVLAIEYLVTGSPAAINAKDRASQDAYFRDALDWIKARHGAENVVYAGIHRDEVTNPHMYAYVVPRVGEKLNCRAYLGGAKALSRMQTDFAEQVGKAHGLERGLEGSKARHKAVKAYYGRLVAPLPKAPNVDVPDPSMGERINLRAYGVRVAQSVVDQLRPYTDMLRAKARDQELAKKAAEEARATAIALDKHLKPIREALQPLSYSETNKTIDALANIVNKAVEAAKQEKLQKAAQQQAAKEANRAPGRDSDLSR